MCPWNTRRRHWHPTPVLLPGKSHGWRSLVGYSPWGRKASNTTERLHFHSSLSCTGEGKGNPLQCSCLENPRDGGAWWAAFLGVAQSRTRLKRFKQQQQQHIIPTTGIPAAKWPLPLVGQIAKSSVIFLRFASIPSICMRILAIKAYVYQQLPRYHCFM